MFSSITNFFKVKHVDGGILSFLATDDYNKVVKRVKEAKKMGYDGVEIICRGIVGKAAPEDQSDILVSNYLKPAGFDLDFADYNMYTTKIRVIFK